MRPVNLIPPEERRGGKTPLRTGPLSYVIVAFLAAALGGATLLVLTSNKVADRKAEVASLQSQVDAAQQQADSLSNYTNFASLQQARQETVESLATSRFDWERTLRELALVLPGDVWLTSVKASASSDSSSAGSASASSPALDGVTGPSLDMNGCASGQAAVAKFAAALRDVDGVTRVSVIRSDRPGAQSSSNTSTDTSSSSSSASSGTNTVECASLNFISTFEVVAAFDGAQPAATTLSPSSPTSPSSATSTTSTTTVSGGGQTTTPTPQQGASGSDSSNGGASASAVVSGPGSAP
jgi:Tfp pilus assembly protein PilN